MKKALILFLFISICGCVEKSVIDYSHLEGLAFGTTFNISMNNDKNMVTEGNIDSLIHVMNRSLSTYIPTSDISKINKGDSTVVVDELFKEVFMKSEVLYNETNGAFDPTIGILVNAWGFGPGEKIHSMKKETVDSLLVFVGFDKVRIINDKLIKDHAETFLDFNANAKGFAVDLIGRFLESKGIQDYLVEIGGEIRARGKNAKGLPWKIAIEKPNFDGSRSFQTVIQLEDESIATSGNYRKFKIDSKTGEKYAHTIDPETGYPSKSNLLSASVIGKKDCADVDGYATAFMAMGLEKSRLFLEKRSDLKAFLIYGDEHGDIKNYTTKNLTIDDNH